MESENEQQHAATTADDELLSRLRVIEDQPLEDRAEAYTHVHDELLRRLESADQPTDA